jgi:polyhydroxyalkanoate synthesis regulator phasin
MAKKLLVKTPVLGSKGVVQQDENGKVLYSETIVELAAKNDFEQANAVLPDIFKRKISVIETEEEAVVEKVDVNALAAQVAELIKQNAELKQQATAPQTSTQPAGLPVGGSGDDDVNNPGSKAAKEAAKAAGAKSEPVK